MGFIKDFIEALIRATINGPIANYPDYVEMRKRERWRKKDKTRETNKTRSN